ncbi:MAG TPA: hypothetical protein VKA84_11095 [Gemmatimonadaceae bacterium]|nr:hypothetical protein [Gemmatimonadaceae bacterium]
MRIFSCGIGRPLRLAAALAAAAVVPSARPLAAQQQSAADSAFATPFRAGQWGAEFAGGPQFSALGLLRFTSPRGAWVANGDVDLAGTRTAQSDPGAGEPETLHNRSASANLRVGQRRYVPLAAHAVRFASAGLIGSWSHERQERVFQTLRQTQWEVGLFGDLGASYLLTPHLSLGLTVGAWATYRDTRQRSEVRLTPPSSGRSRSRGVFLSSSPFSLVGTLYF